PAASSAVIVWILRLPSKPPCALISSAASVWPFNEGSPSTAAALVRKVMCPVLNGVSGILPLGASVAARTSWGPATRPAPAKPVPPTVTPSALRKSRRLTDDGSFMGILRSARNCESIYSRVAPLEFAPFWLCRQGRWDQRRQVRRQLPTGRKSGGMAAFGPEC